MKETLAILQGGLVAFVACVACGWLLLGFLQARLQRVERFGLAAALGASGYSVVLLPLFQTGSVRRSLVTALGAVLLVLAVALRKRVHSEEAPSGPWAWRALTVGAATLFAAIWIMNALAPDLTKPGMSPALEQSAVLWAHHPLPDGEPMSAASPLWAAAFSAGRHSACSLLHTLFLFALTALAYGTMRRWLGAVAGSIAALLVISNPGLGAVAADAGTEVLLLLLACAAVHFAALAWKTAQPRLYAAAALTAAHAVWLARDPQAEWFRGFLFGFLPGPWLVIPVMAVLCAWLFHSNTASAVLIVLFACLTSWPRVTRLLAPSQQRIAASANPGLAFQRKGAEEYLQKNLPGYTEARFLDERTPEGSKILVEPAIARVWTRREVVLPHSWRPLAMSAFDDEYLPDHEQRIQLPAQPRSSWSLENAALVTEVRFYRAGQEVARQPAWRVRCAEAFDNNIVTGCRADLEVRFAGDTVFDEVRLSGKRGTPVRPPRGLRESIRMEWKRQRVTHLLAAPAGDWLDELTRHLPYWHVTDLGERNGARLFRLD